MRHDCKRHEFLEVEGVVHPCCKCNESALDTIKLYESHLNRLQPDVECDHVYYKDVGGFKRMMHDGRVVYFKYCPDCGRKVSQ